MNMFIFYGMKHNFKLIFTSTGNMREGQGEHQKNAVTFAVLF